MEYMNKNNKKKCFISLPIAGREKDVFYRVETAKEEVKRLGFEPISPLDLNELNPNNIDGHEYSAMLFIVVKVGKNQRDVKLNGKLLKFIN